MIVTNCLPEIKVSFHPFLAASERVIVSSSSSVFDLVISIWNTETINLYEEFLVIYLARNNGVIGYRFMNKGSNCGTVVDIKLILCIALNANASSLILIHNHPSGNMKPSKQDLVITEKIKKSSEYMDLKLMDHLIIRSDSYYSFCDEGIL